MNGDTYLWRRWMKMTSGDRRSHNPCWCSTIYDCVNCEIATKPNCECRQLSNLQFQSSVQTFLSTMESKNSNLSSPDDLRPFSCESCGRQFSTSAYLSQHRRIHSGIKPYSCRFCDRKFTQLSHVQQHERIHTGEKPYRCLRCFLRCDIYIVSLIPISLCQLLYMFEIVHPNVESPFPPASAYEKQAFQMFKLLHGLRFPARVREPYGLQAFFY